MISPDLISRLRVNPTTLKALKDFGFEYIPDSDRQPPPPLPPTASIKGLMSPVRNQGSSGTCASFAALANFEFLIKNGANGATPEPNIDLSEGHITHAVERIHGDCKEGLAFAEIAYYLKYNGCVEEIAWPYDQTIVCNPSPPNLAAVRRFYWTPGVRTIDAFIFHREHDEAIKNMNLNLTGGIVATPIYWVDFVRQHIAQARRPVVVDVPVFWGSQGYEAGWGTGYVTMPTPTNLSDWLRDTANGGDVPGSAGWHAVAIIGYDDSKRRFEFKNSWGDRWGSGGFGTLPYEYVTTYTRDAWNVSGGYSIGVGVPPYGI